MNRLSIIVAAVTAGLAPGLAQGQPAAQAEILFRQGKELMDQGKIAEACAAYDAGQKLDPKITGLLIQASCHEKNNQLATAWGLFVEAERQTRTATDDEGKAYHDTAVQHAGRLEPRLSTLTIKVNDDNRVGGLEILEDTTVVDPGAWNHALPIDGGNHKITARAPGNPEWTSSVTVGNEHDAKAIEIPKLTPALLGHDKQPDHHDADTGPARHRELTPLVIGVGAAGVALLGGAVVFDLLGDSQYNDAKAEHDRTKQLDLWHSANTKRYVAETMAVGGLACAGVAVWFFLRGVEEQPRAHTEEAAVFVAPAIAASGAGVQLAGWF